MPGTDVTVDKRTGELVLDTQRPAVSAATITLDDETTVARSGSDPGLWATLLQSGPVQDALVTGVRRLAAGHTPSAFLDQLDGRNVSDTIQPAMLAVARGQSPYLNATGHDGLLRQARKLGLRPAPTEHICAVARLIAWAHADDDVEPLPLEARIDGSFADQSADHRQQVATLLQALARHCRVVVTGSPVDLRRLAVEHLDGGVFSERWTGRVTNQHLDERVDRAVTTLDADSTGAAILRELHAVHDGRKSYNALTSALSTTKATISNWIQRRDDALTELGLVDTIETDRTYVELLPAGEQAIETLDAETTTQQSLSDAFSDVLHPSDHGRVNPRAHEGSVGGDPRRKGKGLAPVGSMERHRAIGAVSAARENGVSVVNQPVVRSDDYRKPSLWTDFDQSRIVVTAEYTNPLQYWVSIARALTQKQTFSILLPALEDEDGGFYGLFQESKDYLRSSRCLGHLADQHDDVADYIDALQTARDDLQELTTQLSRGEYGDRDRFRSEITRDAVGLAGTIVHLCDLADVEIVRELRLPTFSKSFDADRWQDLTKTVATGVAIQSRYGHHSAFRQLFEQRDEKLDWALEPTVDADDPVGELIGSVVIVGDFGDTNGEKTQAFLDDLADRLDYPRPVRDDAPEFVVDVPIRAFEFDREQFTQAVSEMLDWKNLRTTPQAISTMRLLVGTPYDASAALEWLEAEEQCRPVRPSELRYALRNLDTSRLIPHETAQAQRILKVLLVAEERLSTSDLAELADVARSTIVGRSGTTTAGERLEALGLVERTDEGEWRATLSFRDDDERYEEIVPTPATGNHHTVESSLFDVAMTLVDAPERWADPEDPVCGCWTTTVKGLPDIRPLLEHWSWLRDWLPILESAIGTSSVYAAVDEDYGSIEDVATFGRKPSQASIQATTEVAIADD